MVRALEKAHRLLVRGGLLVEVHNEPVAPSLYVEFEDEIIDAGLLQDSARFQEIRQANGTLEQVIRSQYFERVDFQIMHYQIHIDSLDSFDEWKSRLWDTTFIETSAETYIRHSIGSHGSAKKVIVSRVAQVTILKSRSPTQARP